MFSLSFEILGVFGVNMVWMLLLMIIWNGLFEL